MTQVLNETQCSLEEYLSAIAQKGRITFKLLCKSPFADQFKAISTAINSTNARQILYHASIGSNAIPTCACGTQVKWNADAFAYRKYCSKSCTAKASVSERKKHNLSTIGVEWHSQTEEWKSKIAKTSLANFGTTHYSKTAEYLESRTRSNRAKYGVDHVMQLPAVVDTVKSTNVERYGVDNPAKSADVKSKISNTNLIRYGTNCVLSNNAIRETIAATNLEKYGVSNPQQNAAIKRKAVDTTRLNYYSTYQLAKLNDVEWLREQQSTRSVGEIASALSVSSSNLCKIFHKHDIEIVNHSSSSLERKLQEYYTAKNIQFVANTRSIIAPRELDLYFPEYGVAVEVNGCYFHSEQFGKDSTYHISKTRACEEQGIRLLQFWDYEVESKFDVITSIIDKSLGILPIVDATHCSVVFDRSSANEFFKENSLVEMRGNMCIGLEQDGQLICCADVNYHCACYEILNISTVCGLHIANIVNVLVAYVTRNFDADYIVATVDLRVGTTTEFLAAGFEIVENIEPQYFLINSSGCITNSNDEGTFKVWDCGAALLAYYRNTSRL